MLKCCRKSMVNPLPVLYHLPTLTLISSDWSKSNCPVMPVELLQSCRTKGKRFRQKMTYCLLSV